MNLLQKLIESSYTHTHTHPCTHLHNWLPANAIQKLLMRLKRKQSFYLWQLQILLLPNREYKPAKKIHRIMKPSSWQIEWGIPEVRLPQAEMNVKTCKVQILCFIPRVQLFTNILKIAHSRMIYYNPDKPHKHYPQWMDS